ncbi:MAG TPA: metallophosphoesterase, partial [Myxococcota bacterium]|nr:metallophosphoesterase [Myxococcota bacterium]
MVWAGDEGAVLEAELVGLAPGARVTYTVDHDGATSGPWTFRTAVDGATRLRLAAVSDMQQSARDPEKWGEVVHDGILDGVRAIYGEEARDALDGVLLAGDLVEDGERHADWTDAFFGLSHPLGAEVPLLPVLGNHEHDSDWYFRYFHPPDDGTPGFEEHWWSRRLADVLVVGLDSNPPYTNTAQLDWLQGRLDAACSDPGVDFVIVELHHPAWSELWISGNNLWAAAVDDRLNTFASDCGTPAVTLYGHTHGYARGQARDHQHLMVNVATAGGAIDYWGEQAQRDEPAFTVSDDAWGWVLIEVEGGDDPSLVLRRMSRGDNTTALDNVEIDRVEVRASNRPPAAPLAVEPMLSGSPDCLPLATWGFVDPDGDAHQATHWQVAASCDDFDHPIAERWRQSHDWFFGVDLQAGDDLTDETFSDLPEGPVCWRARFRDARLAWSAWSEPVLMSLDPRLRSDERLDGRDAEDGQLAGWDLDGDVEVTG